MFFIYFLAFVRISSSALWPRLENPLGAWKACGIYRAKNVEYRKKRVLACSGCRCCSSIPPAPPPPPPTSPPSRPVTVGRGTYLLESEAPPVRCWRAFGTLLYYHLLHGEIYLKTVSVWVSILGDVLPWFFYCAAALEGPPRTWLLGFLGRGGVTYTALSLVLHA